MKLLKCVVDTTYFCCSREFYQHKFEVAMGSFVSPIVVGISMGVLEEKIISRALITYKL